MNAKSVGSTVILFNDAQISKGQLMMNQNLEKYRSLKYGEDIDEDLDQSFKGMIDLMFLNGQRSD